MLITLITLYKNNWNWKTQLLAYLFPKEIQVITKSIINYTHEKGHLSSTPLHHLHANAEAFLPVSDAQRKSGIMRDAEGRAAA